MYMSMGFQSGTSHGVGSCRRNQPDSREQHTHHASGTVLQLPIHQGGGKIGAANSDKKTTRGGKKPQS